MAEVPGLLERSWPEGVLDMVDASPVVALWKEWRTLANLGHPLGWNYQEKVPSANGVWEKPWWL